MVSRVTTVDTHIGQRVRELRLMLGITQEQIAAMIGTAPQQVHRFEGGINRFSAAHLYLIAHGLGTPITYFFEGLAKKPRAYPRRQRMLFELARNFTDIPNKKYQEVFGHVVRLLADR